MAVRALVLVLVLAAWPLYVGLPNRGEDFVYVYSGARLYWSGGDPYDHVQFQDEVARRLGRPNPYNSAEYRSAYPPAAFWLALPASALPYDAGFLAWSLILWASLAAAGLAAVRLAGAPAAVLLLLLPGLFHSAVMHRLALPAVACLLWALVAFDRKKDVLGGALLSVCCVWPPAYLLCALALARRRSWKALAASTWLPALQLFPYLAGVRPWSDWAGLVSSLSEHARSAAFVDDQSLASAFVRLSRARELWDAAVYAPSPFMTALRGELPLAAAAACAVYARRARSLPLAVAGAAAVAPLAAPYSHAGDQAWLLPALALWAESFCRRARIPRPWLFGAAGFLFWLWTPSYERPVEGRWFWCGFWSAGLVALVLAAEAGLRLAGRRKQQHRG